MPNLPITGLPTVTAPEISGTEPLAIVHSGITKRISITEAQHFIVNHLEPTPLTVSVAGGNVDLNDSTYDEAELIVLSWSGATGNIELTLPDATAAKNLNRVKRIISDSTFTSPTQADLTPRAGQNLDGSSSHYRINKAYEGIQVWCNGTEWFIIQKKA